jgi:hypothetical protein
MRLLLRLGYVTGKLKMKFFLGHENGISYPKGLAPNVLQKGRVLGSFLAIAGVSTLCTLPSPGHSWSACGPSLFIATSSAEVSSARGIVITTICFAGFEGCLFPSLPYMRFAQYHNDSQTRNAIRSSRNFYQSHRLHLRSVPDGLTHRHRSLPCDHRAEARSGKRPSCGTRK